VKLEHFHKYYSHSVGKNKEAVFLGFRFVSAQSQATVGMLLRQSLAKTQKSSLRLATVFLQKLQAKAGKLRIKFKTFIFSPLQP
jgi:hypothetical protein